MVNGSFADSVRRPYDFQGQSPLYFMFLWVWTQVAGDSEVALRLPTIGFTLATVWHLRLLGRELVDRSTGDVVAAFYAVVAIATVSLPEGALWVVARPYGALFFALVVFAVLAVFMHPFAIYAVLSYAVWAWPAMRARRYGQLLSLAGVGIALLLPLIPQVISLAERQAGFSYAETPSILFVAFAPVQIAVVVGVVVAFGFYRSLRPWTETQRIVVGFAVAWMLTAPFGLWAHSVLSGDSVFLFRYFAAAIPGMCLLAAIFVAHIDGQHAAVLAIGGGLVAAIVAVGFVSTAGYERVAERIAEEPQPNVVLATSSLIELRDVHFIDGDAIDYLSAQLNYYGVEPTAILPRFEDAMSKPYLDATFAEAVRSDRLVVVEPVRSAHPEGYYGSIANRRLEAEGFERSVVDLVEEHVVSVFVRMP